MKLENAITLKSYILRRIRPRSRADLVAKQWRRRRRRRRGCGCGCVAVGCWLWWRACSVARGDVGGRCALCLCAQMPSGCIPLYHFLRSLTSRQALVVAPFVEPRLSFSAPLVDKGRKGYRQAFSLSFVEGTEAKDEEPEPHHQQNHHLRQVVMRG